MRSNFFYLFIALIGFTLIVISPIYFTNSVKSLPGVTYAKDHKITSDIASEVVRVWVKPGQQIKQGDTLLQLESQLLSQEIEKLELKVSSMEADRAGQLRSMRSAVNLATSEVELEISELENKIRVLNNQLSLNQKITGSSAGNAISSSELQMRDLEAQVEIRRQELMHRETEIRNRYDLQVNQQNNQEQLLRSELAMFKTKRRSLVRVSDFDGVVGNVYVKPGEVIDEYTDLLSLLPSSPGSVIAYLPSGSNSLPIGGMVTVQSFGIANDTGTVGKVIGHGSIVPLPDILQKATAVKAFGKEIFIEIPIKNTFSSGEKVVIKQRH